MTEGLKVYKMGKRRLLDSLAALNLPVLLLYWLEQIRLRTAVLILLFLSLSVLAGWIVLRNLCRIEIEKGKISGPGVGLKRTAILLRKIDHKRTLRDRAGWGKKLWSVEGEAIVLYPGMFTRGQVDRILETLEKYPFREQETSVR